MSATRRAARGSRAAERLGIGYQVVSVFVLYKARCIVSIMATGYKVHMIKEVG